MAFSSTKLGAGLKGTYRYYILAYEDARYKRPIKHEHSGTTLLTEGT